MQLDVLNLCRTRKTNQITYAYGSLLKTDTLLQSLRRRWLRRPAAVCQNGVMDRVLHPVEPLRFRLTVAGMF